MKQIPNLFTLLNLFFGCLAIVFALQTESILIFVNDGFESSFNIPERLTLASIFIGIAAIVDFLDGFVARLFKATSKLGKELDSLADVVSFGVAPAAIIYQLLRLSFAREEDGLDVSILWLMPAFIYSCAACYRLAKFNLIERESLNFVGLPTPAAALLIASFPLILHFNASTFNIGNLIINKWLLYSMIGLLSYFMLSKISFIGMKFKDYTLTNNLSTVMLISIAIISSIFLQWIAVPVIFISYIIVSLVNKNKLT